MIQGTESRFTTCIPVMQKEVLLSQDLSSIRNKENLKQCNPFLSHSFSQRKLEILLRAIIGYQYEIKQYPLFL